MIQLKIVLVSKQNFETMTQQHFFILYFKTYYLHKKLREEIKNRREKVLEW